MREGERDEGETGEIKRGEQEIKRREEQKKYL